MEKKIKVNFWGNMEFYAELKCYLFGYKNIGEYIEDLIIKDLQNPQDWVTWNARKQMARLERAALELFGTELDQEFEQMKDIIR